jgi:rSAM/selenodomain-associated transferase 2
MISVVIPVLNEAARLEALIGGLRRQGGGHEIIVVDGGSQDGSADLARSLGVTVMTAAGGRGGQLAAGAGQASGDVVLFLHADTGFPEDGLALIEAKLADGKLAGGNFAIHFEGRRLFVRALNRFYAWIRRHGLYYGDSAIFVRSDVLDAIGGIRPLALMEDYDLSRHLEKAGATVCIHESPVITSSRRFDGRSAIAIVWEWLKIHALYHLGVAPERLARSYDSGRQSRASLTRQEWR